MVFGVNDGMLDGGASANMLKTRNVETYIIYHIGIFAGIDISQKRVISTRVLSLMYVSVLLLSLRVFFCQQLKKKDL